MRSDRGRDGAMRELVHSLVDQAPPAPPFPNRVAPSRAARGPRAALAAFVVLALVAGAVAFVAQHSSRDTRPTGTTNAPPSPAPARGLWPIAYVGRAGLFVVDSPSHERVLVEGSVAHPAWSSDGKWLAFERENTQRPRELWVVAASGGTPRMLLPNVVQWSWSPSNPSALVAYSAPLAPDVRRGVDTSQAYVLLADGAWRWKVPLPRVTSVAWANRTGTLAVATGGPNGPRLYLADVSTPPRLCAALTCRSVMKRVSYRLSNPPSLYSLVLDRFTSDDRAVLGWVDELGPGGFATDGSALVAIPTAGGDATRFATMLVKPAWVRAAPTGTDLLVVASSGGVVTDQREVRRCDSAGACLAPLVAGVQTMDPAWSPDGSRIAYVRSDASHEYPPLVGPEQNPDWSARYATRHLWVADGFGKHARAVRGAGDGVAVLGWSDANHVTAVIGDRLRSVDVATGRTIALTGPLGQLGMTLPPESESESEPSWESLVALR